MTRTLTHAELESFPSLEWSEVAPRLSLHARTALEQVMKSLDGRSLTLEQCTLLANADGDDLLAEGLGRRRRHRQAGRAARVARGGARRRAGPLRALRGALRAALTVLRLLIF